MTPMPLPLVVLTPSFDPGVEPVLVWDALDLPWYCIAARPKSQVLSCCNTQHPSQPSIVIHTLPNLFHWLECEKPPGPSGSVDLGTAFRREELHQGAHRLGMLLERAERAGEKANAVATPQIMQPQELRRPHGSLAAGAPWSRRGGGDGVHETAH